MPGRVKGYCVRKSRLQPSSFPKPQSEPRHPRLGESCVALVSFGRTQVHMGMIQALGQIPKHDLPWGKVSRAVDFLSPFGFIYVNCR
jgi:hypothetical protein